jgi:hypothetical protein
MALDTKDTQDAPRPSDSGQMQPRLNRPQTEAGRRAMQGGGNDVADLQERLNQVKTEAAARDAAERAALDRKKTEVTPDAASQTDHRHAVGDAGLAEKVESGAEKREKEVFTGLRGGREGRGRLEG